MIRVRAAQQTSKSIEQAQIFTAIPKQATRKRDENV
jgi:hypothetical protein